MRHNGCTVTNRGPNGDWVQPDADIRLDEQHEATGRNDQAPNPLFEFVNQDKLEGPTYQALINLLNNYVINVRLTEDHIGDNTVEDRERETFLDAILPTPVMVRAREHIESLGFNEEAANLRTELTRIWFDLYTNHFNGIAIPFASGFEHVFVGEGKRRGNGIGGYHCWVKYYLDEQSGRIDFRGFNYDGNFERQSTQGRQNPFVATISSQWNPVDIHGNALPTLEKDLGGFFVGPSPELQIALGTVAFFENVAGQFGHPRADEKEVVLMGGRFRLVLYRNTLENGDRGDRIRSFFPKFIAPVQTTGNEDDMVVDAQQPGMINDGDVRISRALVNPAGSDIGREWVEIENVTDQIINLNRWKLEDKENRQQAIFGLIEPRKTRKIMITRATPNGTQLGNSGGEIRLRNAAGDLVAKVDYGRSSQGSVMFFVNTNE